MAEPTAGRAAEHNAERTAEPTAEQTAGRTARRTAVVAGGGIGGLAVAAALIARGWRVEVLERAERFGEVGAGLSLWPNGMRALDALGLGDAVRVHALHDTQAGIRDVTGRWLSRSDTAELERRHGPVVMVHRAEFLDVLRAAVPADVLRTATTVTAVDTSGPRVRVEHTHGATEADLLIGADGIGSTVRRAVWPHSPAPRYAGYTAWRLVVDLARPATTDTDHPAAGDPARPATTDTDHPAAGDLGRPATIDTDRLAVGGETWGRGERFGMSSLPGGRAYLFGVASVPAGQNSPDGELTELRRRFGTWHEPIPALLAAASPGAVLRHDIYELPALPTYAAGRVALLGDAAHAMTPNLGQGANQALEDAVTLAALLDAYPEVPEALAAYDRARRPRTQMIAKRSRRIGAVAQSRTLTSLRNRLMRLMPASALLNSLTPVLNWRPS